MQLKYFLAASAASVSLACGLAAPVHAQETTSTISGTVTGGGAAVPGATVSILDTSTGATASAKTTTTGSFTVGGLRAGDNYTVTVTAPGYETAQITDVVTIVAQTYQLPVDLTAEGGEAIVVSASRLPGAGSVSQGPVTVLGAAEIENTPSLNRDVRDLSRRDPFARLDDSPSGGRAISFAGQNARYNKFSVDGVPITDNFGLNTDGLPSRRSPIPFDAIGQFQSKVAPYDVREGNFQGGAINIVLKSGTNQFHGGAFYSFSADELVGDQTKPGPGIPTGKTKIPNFRIDNYGAEIDGPIIKDKLFFMIAGERLRGGRPIPEGPTDNNAGTAIPNLTQAQVDNVSAIAKSVYGYDTGGVQRSLDDTDDRLVARLDANLSERQRASLTYTYAKDGITLLNNTFSSISTGSPGLGLKSNAYTQGNRLHTGVFQLNSDWTDEFSTEVRGFYKDYVRIQDPLLGRGFAQFRVCLDPVSGGSATNCEGGVANGVPVGAGTAPIVSFGPDNSRQTNALNSQTWGGLIQGRLTRENHDLRIFGEYQDVRIFNAFLQNSSGNYYFDSLADFQNRIASSISYQNAIPSLDPNDSAARFGYQLYTFGIMDKWQVTPDFDVTYGMRYDMYGQSERPALSNAFFSRYGVARTVMGESRVIGTNTANINGLALFQPRLGFNWRPFDRLKIRGGGGIFGGGTPDVYVSNSFSNTGVLTNSITINRAAPNTNTYSNATTNVATGNAILNGVTGSAIPGAADALLLNAAVATNSTVNALDPKFKLPSQWRATLSFDYDADLGALGDGWHFGADLLYSKVRNQVFFTDIRSQPVTVAANALTPDGRQRYQDLIGGPTSTNTNTDILLTNTKKGRTKIGVVRFEKDWNFGLGINASFTYQDVKDQAPATSSTAGSNYTNGAFVDPNNVAYGISNDQVKYSFKYGVNYAHAFFGDYKTNIALFGETRIGHVFSYTMQDFGSGRSAVFGTIGRGANGAGQRYLLYVPTGLNDPLVSYSDATYAAALDAFISSSGLDKYRGKIAPRNKFNSPWITRLDLHVSQELPTFVGKSRITLFADVENFTNLINKKWGQISEYVFPYNAAVTQVQCLTTAGNANGAGTVATNVSQPCKQYRYSPLGGTTTFTPPTDQVYVNQSLYAIRIGAKIKF